MTTSTHDLVIVGGGIGGVIALRYARTAGLDAVLLEKQSGVGGLWRTLPDWQDLQILKEDWTLGDIPIADETAPSVRANIQAWVDVFALADGIVTDCEVSGAAWRGDHWDIRTTRGPYRGRFLLTATGAHNKARVPAVERRASKITEHHSSTLRDPETLRGQRVAVVGGGASAQDVLVQALEHGAAELHWIYRSVAWFTPTRRRKHEAVGLRLLGRQQLLGFSAARISAVIDRTVTERFARYDIKDLRPDGAFDLEKHQMVPGRARLLEDLATITRRKSQVAVLDGDQVVLETGERFSCDVVVWATGYDLDLGYTGIEDFASARRPADMAKHLHSLVLAKKHPNLFVFGPALLDTNGSAPFFYSHLAKAVAARIRGRDVIARRSIDHMVNYFDLVHMLAKADRRTYPPALWRLPYLRRLWRWQKATPLPLP